MLLNTLPPLTKNVTCALTGHRVLSSSFDRNLVKAELKSIAKKGYEYFLDGMALGFDSECFRVLEELRAEGENIKIVAVVPCSDQSAKFTLAQKVEYDRMLKSADLVVAEEKTYYEGCMFARNDFLVDNASIVVAGWRGVKTGGTYYTLSRAEKTGVKAIIVPV